MVAHFQTVIFDFITVHATGYLNQAELCVLQQDGGNCDVSFFMVITHSLNFSLIYG